MPAVICLLCGYDFPIWLGTPPEQGRCLTTSSADHCEWALDRAYGESVRLKMCPDAFDADGKIKPGQLARVLTTLEAAGLDGFTGQPRSGGRNAQRTI